MLSPFDFKNEESDFVKFLAQYPDLKNVIFSYIDHNTGLSNLALCSKACFRIEFYEMCAKRPICFAKYPSHITTITSFFSVSKKKTISIEYSQLNAYQPFENPSYSKLLKYPLEFPNLELLNCDPRQTMFDALEEKISFASVVNLLVTVRDKTIEKYECFEFPNRFQNLRTLTIKFAQSSVNISQIDLPSKLSSLKIEAWSHLTIDLSEIASDVKLTIDCNSVNLRSQTETIYFEELNLNANNLNIGSFELKVENLKIHKLEQISELRNSEIGNLFVDLFGLMKLQSWPDISDFNAKINNIFILNGTPKFMPKRKPLWDAIIKSKATIYFQIEDFTLDVAKYLEFLFLFLDAGLDDLSFGFFLRKNAIDSSYEIHQQYVPFDGTYLYLFKCDPNFLRLNDFDDILCDTTSKINVEKALLFNSKYEHYRFTFNTSQFKPIENPFTSTMPLSSFKFNYSCMKQSLKASHLHSLIIGRKWADRIFRIFDFNCKVEMSTEIPDPHFTFFEALLYSFLLQYGFINKLMYVYTEMQYKETIVFDDYWNNWNAYNGWDFQLPVTNNKLAHPRFYCLVYTLLGYIDLPIREKMMDPIFNTDPDIYHISFPKTLHSPLNPNLNLWVDFISKKLTTTLKQKRSEYDCDPPTKSIKPN